MDFPYYLNYGCAYSSFTNYFTILYWLILYSMHCKRMYTFPHILNSFRVFLDNVKICENNSLLRLSGIDMFIGVMYFIT